MDAKEYLKKYRLGDDSDMSLKYVVKYMESYHKAKLEELLPSDEDVLKVFPLMKEDEEAMRMNSLIRIGIKWLRDKLKGE